MNLKKNYFGILTAAALALASCSSGSDLGETSGSRGTIQLASLQLDPNVTRSSGLSSDDDQTQTQSQETALQPAVDSCTLVIKSLTGTYLQSWKHVSDYKPSDEAIPVGTYDVTLSYGALENEGFDSPYYYGTAQTTVKEDETSDVAVEATLHNTMVRIKYTDAFKKYFTDYSATIHSEGGKYIDIAKEETRAAYVRPGNIAIDLSVTKPNGLSGTFEVDGITDAKERTLYNVTVDVNGGNVGDAQIKITFDEETIEEPITIKVSDEILAAPAPTITADNFTPGTALAVFEGTVLADAPKMQVMARSGIKEVKLTTQSSYLLANNFPSELDLMAATAEQQKTMESFGFHPAGLWKDTEAQQAKVFALLDFSTLISKLKGASDNNNTSTFTLQVKDKYNKVSEQAVELKVNLTPLVLKFTECTQQVLGAGTATVTVQYNGADFEKDVKIKSYKTVDGQSVLTDCTVSNVQKSGDDTYTATVSLPNKYSDNTLNLYYNGRCMESVAKITLQGFSLAYEEANVWAKHATISVKDAYGKAMSVADQTISFYTSTGQIAEANIDRTSGTSGIIKLNNLTPGTKYTVYAQNTSKGLTSAEISFTTETAADVENGTFEKTEAVENLTNRKIQQGGMWSNQKNLVNIKTGPNYETYNVTGPKNWATTNSKTAYEQAENKNTWFFAPSVQSVTDKHGGSAAVEIRSIGWHTNGTTPDRNWHSDGNKTLWCTNTPSELYTAAGKMFLGSYSFDGTKETYNQGKAFTSRPTKMKFWAKYTHNNSNASDGEYGEAIVTLLDKDGNTIASGTAEIGKGANVTSWTEYTVNLTYSVTNKKAATLRIFFTSSNNYDNSTLNESKVLTTKTTEYVQKAIGAVLYVDDVTFEY